MIFCIDMKSFFASVECSIRKLNPLTTPLVVCDKTRGDGALILAATPYLKALGVPNRCRLFEIPKNIKFICAKPRMKRYMEYTALIHKIFLEYVDQSDIHTYSVDESFLDVSSYLKYHNISPDMLANQILNKIKYKLGIVAVCGAGDNLFLAKVSLDLYAKKNRELFFYLSKEYFRKNTWYYKPLTDIWQIGCRMEKRLNRLNLYNLYDIANCNPEILKKEFGVNGTDLFFRANGEDDVCIGDIKSYRPLSKSMSRNQVLFRDYSKEESWTILCEMIYLLCMDLIKENIMCKTVFFGVQFSDSLGGVGKSFSLDSISNNYFFIKEEIKKRYFYIVEEKKIRVLYLSFSNFIKSEDKIYNLFELEDDKYLSLSKNIINIWNKYGKNKIVLGTAVTNESTIYKRNKCIGGHNDD